MTELPTSLPRSSRFLQLGSDERRVSQIIRPQNGLPRPPNLKHRVSFITQLFFLIALCSFLSQHLSKFVAEETVSIFALHVS